MFVHQPMEVLFNLPPPIYLQGRLGFRLRAAALASFTCQRGERPAIFGHQQDGVRVLPYESLFLPTSSFSDAVFDSDRSMLCAPCLSGILDMFPMNLLTSPFPFLLGFLYCLYSRPYYGSLRELFVAVYSQDFEPGSLTFGSLGC